ncbi:MAG TPA: hypothetical protein VK254_04965, partial [Candidatus Bathyarchaeia archaeon]|nr:hypothetical protein [Candidatus Bathyarchaeia archaeon]
NTIRYQVVFNKPSPFGKKGGGVSGGPAKRRAMEYNKELPKWVSVPLIFGCGVENPLDVGRYQDMGGSAVSICSLAIRRPRTARFVVEQFNG